MSLVARAFPPQCSVDIQREKTTASALDGTMPDQSTIYIGSAFFAGALLALVCKEMLESHLQHQSSTESKSQSDVLVARSGPPAIVEGIQGCIGNTPLFRIKSLSDETGCEILAKAEVG